MSEKLKILMITSEYPTADNPQAVPFIARQVEHLKKAGADVDVFHFKGKKNLLLYIGAWFRLRRHTRGKRYDLMHAQWGHSATLALPKRIPWVITFRGNDLEGIIGANGAPTFLGKILTTVSKTMARAADAVIVVSESLAKRIERDDYVVIPSGLDLETFRPASRTKSRKLLGLPAKKRLILFAASSIHNPRKRYDLAKRAVAIVGKRFDAELVTATNRPHAEIAAYMNACDALLLTSVHEGSPNVVKEALACNLPVVSVDVGDVRRRIEGIDGCHVCRNDDPATIAGNLIEVLERRRRINGREAIADLDERQTTRKVLAIYDAVVGAAETARSASRAAELSSHL